MLSRASILVLSCLYALAVDTDHIKYVHVVYMNHLDVGYNVDPGPGYTYNVINKYFNEYYPKAINTANYLRAHRLDNLFTYTTHPWLVSLYMDCEEQNINMNNMLICPNNTMKQDFIGAVHRGDISWHAGPFNAENELFESSMFHYSISISHDLDTLFGKNKTIAVSQRDVPGLTKAVIPILNDMGVRGLSVGVNSLSAPPAVPKAFVWKYDDDHSLISLFHPFGYGGIKIDDCVILDNFEHALAFAFKGDNEGPQSEEEVLEIRSELQIEFPKAQIIRSTYDDYIKLLEPIQDTLPVVTQEIGDTWIHGVASDPLKLAIMREVMRASSDCIKNGICDFSNPTPAFKNFTRFFVKTVEHTWGVTSSDLFTSLDYAKWDNDKFEAGRDSTAFQESEFSWVEQREYIDWALDALRLGQSVSDKYLINDIESRLTTLYNVQVPDTSSFQLVYQQSQSTGSIPIFECGRWKISFNQQTGAVNYLVDTITNTQWASSDSQFLLIEYQTFTEKDFIHFIQEYSPCTGTEECEISLRTDFSKPNLQQFSDDAIRSDVFPTLNSLWINQQQTNTKFLIELFMNEEVHTKFGAPSSLWIELELEHNRQSLYAVVNWFNKTTTRLPESIWVTFRPSVSGVSDSWWRVDKLGSWIDPADVVLNGSQHLHGVWSAVNFYGEDSEDDLRVMSIAPLDAGLLSFGDVNPFPTPLKPGSTKFDQVSFNLYNNIWDTNYILWYPYLDEDKDSKFRFHITLQ